MIAIDTGDAKRKMCLDLGATVFLDFKTDDVRGIISLVFMAFDGKSD